MLHAGDGARLRGVFVPACEAIGRVDRDRGRLAAAAVDDVLIVRVLVSAAFLAGVYGAFGKAAASFALIAVALVIEVVGLLPIVPGQVPDARARPPRIDRAGARALLAVWTLPSTDEHCIMQDKYGVRLFHLGP